MGRTAEIVGQLARRRDDLSSSEADIQSDIKTLLLTADFELGDSDVFVGDTHLESQVGHQQRIDVQLGHLVIETKKDLRRSGVQPRAEEQLASYLRHRAVETGSRYLGVLTDGHDWRLNTLTVAGDTQTVSRLQVSGAEDATRLVSWLSTVLATRHHLGATASEIDRQFGADSPAHAADKAALLDLWDSNQSDTELQLKRELWAKLLTTAFGSSFENSPDLFVEHTYLVIVAEMIAHELLGVPTVGVDPVELVSGKLFRDAGIFNVVESDFFDWPVHLPGGSSVVRSIAQRVQQIDWSTAKHDVLKHLYESVITPERRKKLGEYYTRDALAEVIVDSAVDEPATQRVLDPACGSGTFLFHAVRRVLAALDERGIDNAKALHHVTGHVTGMDLHPVAVALARVTYLLAIGAERLQNNRDEITVPVYMSDSLQWTNGGTISDSLGLHIPVSDDTGLLAEELVFPEAALSDPDRFARLLNEMTDLATGRPPGSKHPPFTGVLRRLGLPEADAALLRDTYELMCTLHDQHRDGIWSYYVRNVARPWWMSQGGGRVDCIVGNPPWLAYRFMDKETQAAYKTMTQTRNLWAGGKVATQQDLSALFVARTCELYLNDGGRFAQVMPRATLDRKSQAGFRAADWGHAGFAQFTTAWDLDGITPDLFPVPSCVVFGTYHRSASTTGHHGTPLKGATEKWVGRMQQRDTWADCRPRIERTPATEHVDTSDTAHASPYGDGFRQGAVLVPRMLMFVNLETPATGLGLPGSVVQVRSARGSQEKAPWKTLPDLSGTVERRFVHPVHLGSTLLPFRMLEPMHAVLPFGMQDGVTHDLSGYPHMRRWWGNASDLWDQYGSGKMTLDQQIDYMHKLSDQKDSAPIRLVYSKAGTRLTAAILDDPKCVIDHKLYWAPIHFREEGHYLSAVLNAETTQEEVGPYQTRGLMGARDFDMYVWRLPIPRFDADNEIHAELAALGAQAAETAADVDVSGMGFQKARKAVRETLGAEGITGRIEDLVRSFFGGHAGSN